MIKLRSSLSTNLLIEIPRNRIQQSLSLLCRLNSSIVTFLIRPPWPWRSWPLSPSLTQSINDLPGFKATLGRFPATGPTVTLSFRFDPNMATLSPSFTSLFSFLIVTPPFERDFIFCLFCTGSGELLPQPRLPVDVYSHEKRWSGNTMWRKTCIAIYLMEVPSASLILPSSLSITTATTILKVIPNAHVMVTTVHLFISIVLHCQMPF